MILLGIDTSATVCSAAIVRDGHVLAHASRNDGLTHSQTLLPMIQELFERADLSVSDVDGIAVSCGPGSFTGLRIGISTVKGLSLGTSCGCVALSTLEALAWNCTAYEGSVVCAVMDARRGEFYNALFRIESGVPQRLTEDRAISCDLLSSELLGKENLVIVGDGAQKFCTMVPALAEFLAREEDRFQSGISVAKLGIQIAAEKGFVSCDSLSPRYLRLPQAEREWNEKHPQ